MKIFLFLVLAGVGLAACSHAPTSTSTGESVAQDPRKPASVPDFTFITAEDYFAMNGQEGYTAHFLAQNHGLTVLTDGMRNAMLANQPITAYLVVEVDPNGQQFTNFKKSVRGYKLNFVDIKSDANTFGTGWTVVMIEGRGKDFERFLSAKRSLVGTRWAGLAEPADFLERARKLFTREEVYKNEIW